MGNAIEKKLSVVPAKMMEQQREVMLKQRELQMAMTLAGAKDRLEWMSAFAATLTGIGLVGISRGKLTPTALAPLLPLSFIIGWHYDFVYGTKLDRMRSEAERILREDADKLQVPEGNLLISPQLYSNIFISSSKRWFRTKGPKIDDKA